MESYIDTIHGRFKYEPVTFELGSKTINKEISGKNLLLFKKIMDTANIKFILAYGTLLGVIRENDFIAHDEDTDVIILDEERTNFLNTLFDFRANGFEVGRYEDDLLSLIRDNEYIDIYIFKKSCWGHRKMGPETTKEDFLVNTIKYDFLGQKFDIPKNYIEYCIYNYGKNWQKPIIDEHAYKPNLSTRTRSFMKKNFKLLYLFLSWIKNRLK